MDAYFEALKTPQLTDTGAQRDRFSFTYPTDKWKALSETGVEAGYGIEWQLSNATPPTARARGLCGAGQPGGCGRPHTR